jgi:glycosyltransferase involved in cell wall biosynthesis
MENNFNQKLNPEISIVILCYKAGALIIEFVERVINIFEAEKIFDYELILVGNYIKGSDDKTPEVIAKLAREIPKILYTAEPKKGMMGWDMKCGLKKASGKYIAVIDGDGQMPVEDLIKVYKKIKKENLDLVKTYRIKRGDGWRRKMLSAFYNLIFNILFPGLNSKDINSKPKIMTDDSYKKLNLESDDWFIDAEIMIQARHLKFKIKEAPTLFLGLSGKRKSFVKFPAILEFIKNLIYFRIKEFRKK